MAKPFKTYFCRLPQACVDLIKFETARVDAGYPTSRALVSKMLEDFLADAPWHKKAWEFPSVPDVRKYGGDKTGSVQYNIFVSPELATRLDTAIHAAGTSKASFFLGAICWWLSRNLHDANARKLFDETAKGIGFTYRENTEEKNPEGDEDAKEEQKTGLKMEVSKVEPSNAQPPRSEKKHPDYEPPIGPSGIGAVLDQVQRKSTSGLVTSDTVLAEIARLKPLVDRYGKEADGSSFWFVGQEGDPSIDSYRKRATMVELQVREGDWYMVQCYRTLVRAKPTQIGKLTLAPLVHARRGEEALESYDSENAKWMHRSPGEFLKKQCANESLTFWLGFLIRSVAKEKMTPDEATVLATWRMEKPDTEVGEVLTFAQDYFPVINRDVTDAVMRLLADGCEDEALLIKAMARSTDRISDPDYKRAWR